MGQDDHGPPRAGTGSRRRAVGVDVVAEVILEHTRQLVAQRADRLTDVGVEVFVQRLLFDFLANLRRRRVVRIIWVGLLLLLL